MPHEKSIRERALEAMVQHFKDQEAGQPVPDPYTVTWDLVFRQDIRDVAHGKRYALSIFDTREEKTPGIITTPDGMSDASLRVVLEWRQYVDADQDPSEEANRVLMEVQRRLGEADRDQLGGLVLDIDETGNEINIDDYKDRLVWGAVFCVVRYRHKRGDPRVDVC